MLRFSSQTDFLFIILFSWLWSAHTLVSRVIITLMTFMQFEIPIKQGCWIYWFFLKVFMRAIFNTFNIVTPVLINLRIFDIHKQEVTLVVKKKKITKINKNGITPPLFPPISNHPKIPPIKVCYVYIVFMKFSLHCVIKLSHIMYSTVMCFNIFL